jgi:hypothetical protein
MRTKPLALEGHVRRSVEGSAARLRYLQRGSGICSAGAPRLTASSQPKLRSGRAAIALEPSRRHGLNEGQLYRLLVESSAKTEISWRSPHTSIKPRLSRNFAEFSATA